MSGFINEACNKVKEFIPKDKLEIDKLPKWQQNLMNDILIPLLNTVPQSAILQGLNAKSAQALAIRRVKVRIDVKTEVPCNYYGITFMPSGTGKNKLVNVIEKYLFDKISNNFEILRENYTQAKLNQIEEKALEIKSKAVRSKYLEDHRPRHLHWQTSDGTPEGFMTDRQAFKDAGFGGTFFLNSEFLDYILHTNNNRNHLLTLLSEVYDLGNDHGKSIKYAGDNPSAIDGIPSNILVFGSVSGMHEEGTHDRLINILNKQLARRSFICYPFEDEYPKQEFNTLDDYVRRERYISFDIGAISDKYSNELFNTFQRIGDGSVLIPDEKAYSLYLAYRIYLNNKADKLSPYSHDGLRGELLGRYWKAIKLAGILQSFKNSESFEIDEDSMGSAIYQAEFFGRYFEKFYDDKPVSDAQMLYSYLLNRKNTWVTKGDIRDKAFVSKNIFSKWFNDVLGVLEEIAIGEGYLLERQSYGRNGMQYMIKEA